MKTEHKFNPFVQKIADRHTNENKKRWLPDVFYLRWEMELLAAVVLLFVVMEVPGRAIANMQLLFPGSKNITATFWVTILSDILMAGLCIYIFLRILWWWLTGTCQNASPHILHLTGYLDEIAEMLISVCIIFLVICFFAYLINLLIIFFENKLPDQLSRPFNVSHKTFMQ